MIDKQETREIAMDLLRLMAVLGQAAETGDPLAKPYLDADAIRAVDGKAGFHKERFLAELVRQLVIG